MDQAGRKLVLEMRLCKPETRTPILRTEPGLSQTETQAIDFGGVIVYSYTQDTI